MSAKTQRREARSFKKLKTKNSDAMEMEGFRRETVGIHKRVVRGSLKRNCLSLRVFALIS